MLLAVGLFAMVGMGAVSGEPANAPSLAPVSAHVRVRVRRSELRVRAPVPPVLDGDLARAAAAHHSRSRAAPLRSTPRSRSGEGRRRARSELEFDELRERLANERLELMPILPELAALHSAGAPALVSLRDASGTAHLALLRSAVGRLRAASTASCPA